MSRSTKTALALLSVAGAWLLMAPGPASADPPPGSSKMWPWNVQGYQAQSYNEPRAPAPPPPVTYYRPSKYTITAAQFPKEASAGDPNSVMLMAHLPEDALFWVE